MSRHLLVDRPDFQLVVGFDHMLRSFFGQVFNPARDSGTAIRGWPTRSGLGLRRPATSYAEAAKDLALLMAWARNRLTGPELEPIEVSDHFRVIESKLRFEWNEGSDVHTIPVPACLKVERS